MTGELAEEAAMPPSLIDLKSVVESLVLATANLPVRSEVSAHEEETKPQ